MNSDNLQKKKVIDRALANFNLKILDLQQKRDKIISDFLEVLREKRLEELRNLLK